MWAVIDPEELIIGGNNDGVPLWKHGLATEQARDEAICGQCNFSNFARLCLTDMNIPLSSAGWPPVRHRLLGEHRHPPEMGTGNLRHRHQPPEPVL